MKDKKELLKAIGLIGIGIFLLIISYAFLTGGSTIVMHDDPKILDGIVILNYQGYNTADMSKVGIKGIATNQFWSALHRTDVSLKNVTITLKVFDANNQFISENSYTIPVLDKTAPFDISVPATGVFKDGSSKYNQKVSVNYDK